MQNAVKFGLSWLSQSEIRDTSDGGVKQGYNWQSRDYPFVYSEITGYAISMFVCADRWFENSGYLDLASQSAEFLMKLQEQTAESRLRGAIPLGLSLPDHQLMPRYYSFDSAMCLQGFLDLHSVQPADRLLASGRAIGDWLLQPMQQDNGSFLSFYDAEADEWHHIGDNFFDDYGCLHAKHAIGLLKLSQATGDERYTTAARKVCDWVLSLQDEDGAFRASANLSQVVSHPHCYVLEGLLYAHYVTRQEKYLQAALRGGEWLRHIQNKDGSINIEYKRPIWRMGRRIVEKLKPRRVTDASSQALRIWLLLYYLQGNQQFLDAARRAANFLRDMQCLSSEDGNAVGGFYFEPGHPTMFTWATMFSVHALYALEHVERGYERLIAELF